MLRVFANLGKQGLDEYLTTKTISIQLSPSAGRWDTGKLL